MVCSPPHVKPPSIPFPPFAPSPRPHPLPLATTTLLSVSTRLSFVLCSIPSPFSASSIQDSGLSAEGCPLSKEPNPRSGPWRPRLPFGFLDFASSSPRLRKFHERLGWRGHSPETTPGPLVPSFALAAEGRAGGLFLGRQRLNMGGWWARWFCGDCPAQGCSHSQNVNKGARQGSNKTLLINTAESWIQPPARFGMNHLLLPQVRFPVGSPSLGPAGLRGESPGLGLLSPLL